MAQVILTNYLEKTELDEIYNLSVQSHAQVSCKVSKYAEVDAISIL